MANHDVKALAVVDYDEYLRLKRVDDLNKDLTKEISQLKLELSQRPNVKKKLREDSPEDNSIKSNLPQQQGSGANWSQLTGGQPEVQPQSVFNSPGNQQSNEDALVGSSTVVNSDDQSDAATDAKEELHLCIAPLRLLQLSAGPG